MQDTRSAIADSTEPADFVDAFALSTRSGSLCPKRRLHWQEWRIPTLL